MPDEAGLDIEVRTRTDLSETLRSPTPEDMMRDWISNQFGNKLIDSLLELRDKKAGIYTRLAELQQGFLTTVYKFKAVSAQLGEPLYKTNSLVINSIHDIVDSVDNDASIRPQVRSELKEDIISHLVGPISTIRFIDFMSQAMGDTAVVEAAVSYDPQEDAFHKVDLKLDFGQIDPKTGEHVVWFFQLKTGPLDMAEITDVDPSFSVKETDQEELMRYGRRYEQTHPNTQVRTILATNPAHLENKRTGSLSRIFVDTNDNLKDRNDALAFTRITKEIGII